MEENKMATEQPRGLLNWWQGLILAASSAIIGVVAALFIRPGASLPSDGPSWAMQLLRFTPHFLMLFGILADAFTYEGVYWTGTAVGAASTFLAPWITGAITRLLAALREAMTGQTGGEYLGQKMLSPDEDASATPETLVVTASILAYYIFDLVTNLSVIDAAGAIVAALILFGGQAIAVPGGSDKAGMSGAIGVAIGGASFGLFTAVAPQYLPSTVLAGSKSAGPGGASGPGRRGIGMSSGPGGNTTTSLAQTNGAPGSAATCPS